MPVSVDGRGDGVGAVAALHVAQAHPQLGQQIVLAPVIVTVDIYYVTAMFDNV